MNFSSALSPPTVIRTTSGLSKYWNATALSVKVYCIRRNLPTTEIYTITWCILSPNICRPVPEDYDEILQVWEDSVRHTHHFLTEEHIQFYKPLVRNHYLSAVELYIIRNTNGKIVAFMGLSDELIEMLFVSPGEQGKGYGRRLLEYATRRKQINKVDVNEQNDKALGFYLRMDSGSIAEMKQTVMASLIRFSICNCRRQRTATSKNNSFSPPKKT